VKTRFYLGPMALTDLRLRCIWALAWFLKTLHSSRCRGATPRSSWRFAGGLLRPSGRENNATQAHRWPEWALRRGTWIMLGSQVAGQVVGSFRHRRQRRLRVCGVMTTCTVSFNGILRTSPSARCHRKDRNVINRRENAAISLSG